MHDNTRAEISSYRIFPELSLGEFRSQAAHGSLPLINPLRGKTGPRPMDVYALVTYTESGEEVVILAQGSAGCERRKMINDLRQRLHLF